uniref:NADH dehydrogenase subunit 2 n=1 Tax=Narcine timlei TaxID=195316 RepID=UPI002209B124|nr:NADH dehydrogenase subunit 2 [Narcine timlei]UXL87066.1 NADH dehydrogenase subunit 2 [Narcine timlei]
MNPFIIIVLVLSLITGTLMTFTMTNWLLIWMGLEINTMAIIPMMIHKHHPRATEATTKYFITQATASAMLLFSGTVNAWLTGQWELTQTTNQMLMALITLAIALKMGLAPMHFWLPEVLQGINYMAGLILLTWQKLAPMAILIQIYPMINPNLLTSIGIISILVGGWGGLNQTQLRKLMAYSSIAHMGWMMVILHFMHNLMTLNLMMYLILTTSFLMILMNINATKINSMTLMTHKKPLTIMISLMILMSLGGLPPLSGFMPKWLILQELINQNMAPTATIMALAALLSLFFYLRLTYMISLTLSPNLSITTSMWKTPTPQSNTLLTISTTLSILLLPLTPTMLMMTM